MQPGDTSQGGERQSTISKHFFHGLRPAVFYYRRGIMSAEPISGPKKHFAIFSGLCASGASFFGKLTGEAALVEFEVLQQIGIGPSIWLIRAVCFALMVLCNAFVWTFYVKALHSTSGTLTATVTSAATNYFVSFILGVFIFGEEVTMFTMMGISLILVGLFFLTRDADAKKRD